MGQIVVYLTSVRILFLCFFYGSPTKENEVGLKEPPKFIMNWSPIFRIKALPNPKEEEAIPYESNTSPVSSFSWSPR